jgi:hypothetical protein
MTAPTTVALETAKRMTAQQELDLVRAAHARNPASRELRGRLAGLLNSSDRHRETLTLLTGAADLDFGEAMMMTRALLALEDPEATWEAHEAANLAFSLADGDRGRAAALADLGKAEIRLGHPRRGARLSARWSSIRTTRTPASGWPRFTSPLTSPPRRWP